MFEIVLSAVYKNNVDGMQWQRYLGFQFGRQTNADLVTV